MNGNYNRDRNRGFGGGDRKPSGGGGQQKSQEDFVKDAKTHFGNHYDHLLAMKDYKDLDGLDAQLKAYVKSNYEDVTTGQLRNIYSKIKPIDKKDKNKLKMQRPKLAYVIARQNKKQGALALMYWFDDLIGKVQTDDDVQGFKDLMEAVVAYHKYYETLNPPKRK